MARPQKNGIDYFPMDVTTFSDIKIRKMIKYKGGGSVSIYLYLLCNIYSNGYYIKYEEDLPFLISENTGLEEEYISDVLNYFFEIGVFCKELKNKSNIISSKGIQIRYSEICRLAKRTSNINEFNLVSSEETIVNPEETRVNPEETPKKVEESTQSKVNESKVKSTTTTTDVVNENNSLPPDQSRSFTPVDLARNKVYTNSENATELFKPNRGQQRQELMRIYNRNDEKILISFVRAFNSHRIKKVLPEATYREYSFHLSNWLTVLKNTNELQGYITEFTKPVHDGLSDTDRILKERGLL